MALNIQVLSDNRLFPTVFNVIQGSNKVNTVVYTLENYIVGEQDLSTYNWYVHLIGVDGVDAVKLTSAVVNGKLEVTFDLTEYITRLGNTLTYQLVAKDDKSAVWNSAKGVILNAESINADDKIVAEYPSILRQWELRIEEMAGSLDTAIYYIAYNETLPKEDRMAGRLYFKYLYAENKNGQLEDAECNILIPEQVAKNIGISAIDGLTAATVQEALQALKVMIENKDSLPAQAGNTGKYLRTNGESAEWADVENLPDQTGKEGKYLRTNGKSITWEDAPRGLPLLTSIWADHKLNDVSYLRADNFTWHSGDVYVAAYEHLLNDYNSLSTGVLYAYYAEDAGETFYLRTDTPSVGDQLLDETGTPAYEAYGEHKVKEIYDDGSFARTATFPGNRYYRVASKDIALSTPESKTETINGITITYYQAEDGHKICLADQEANVQRLYDATGVAWYYVLDTANKQFKLPRTQFGFTGLRDSVGGYVEAGLPNITGEIFAGGTYGFSAFTSANGAFKSGTHTDWRATTQQQNIAGATEGVYFDASRSNSTYGNSNTVQPEATQMYLYFYVGNYVRGLDEINIGVLSEKFNEKVDVDASNLSVEGKSFITNLSMPDYAAPVVVSNPFTCPADGYLKVFWNGNYTLKIDGVQQAAYEVGSGTAIGGHVFIPLKKGSVVESTIASKFYPCIGAK